MVATNNDVQFHVGKSISVTEMSSQSQSGLGVLSNDNNYYDNQMVNVIGTDKRNKICDAPIGKKHCQSDSQHAKQFEKIIHLNSNTNQNCAPTGESHTYTDDESIGSYQNNNEHDNGNGICAATGILMDFSTGTHRIFLILYCIRCSHFDKIISL